MNEKNNPFVGIVDVGQAEQIFTDFRKENQDDRTIIIGLLKDLLEALFSSEKPLHGDANDFHNFAVSISKFSNDNKGAYSIVKEGLRIHNVNTDLLADALMYGYNCGEKQECEQYFSILQTIDKSRWTWRAFTFSINYLLDVQGTTSKYDYSTETILEIVKEYKKINPYEEDAWLAEYNIYDKTNRKEEAIRVLEDAISRFSFSPKCWLRYADLMIDRGEYQKVIPIVKKMLRNPKTTDTVNPSYMYFLDGQCKLAILMDSSEYELGNFDDRAIQSIYRSFHLARNSNGLREETDNRIEDYITRLTIETQIPYDNNY